MTGSFGGGARRLRAGAGYQPVAIRRLRAGRAARRNTRIVRTAYPQEAWSCAKRAAAGRDASAWSAS